MARKHRKPKREKPKQRLRRLFDTHMAQQPTAAPRCPHVGACGGCSYQHVDPAGQARARVAVLRALADELGAGEVLAGQAIDLVSSPSAFDYRQRMDYVTAFGSAGLRRRGSPFAVVDLRACHLIGSAAWNCFQRAVALVREAGISDHDFREHVGELRYVVVRRNRQDDVLCTMVTHTREADAVIAKIAEQLLAEGVAVSVHHLHQPGLADLSFGDPIAHWGQPTISERLGEQSFAIGPNTFFQANPAVAEQAYARIAGHAQALGARRVVDAYAGTGTISCFLAPHVETVFAVENVAENVALAQANAAANGVSNVEVLCDDAVPHLGRVAADVDLVVVNPPRVGITEAGVAGLLESRPPAISYMSCNPLTLLTELQGLSEAYDLTDVAVLDMFPQTPHFETLVHLRRRD